MLNIYILLMIGLSHSPYGYLRFLEMFFQPVQFSSGSVTSSSGCCVSKTVGGATYTLVGATDTSHYNCKNDCVYSKQGSTVKYCFAHGDLPVENCQPGTPVTKIEQCT